MDLLIDWLCLANKNRLPHSQWSSLTLERICIVNPAISLDNYEVNRFSTRDFLKLFGGEIQWFRVLDDKEVHKPKIDRRDIFSNVEQELFELNSKGYGIHFVPNLVKAKGTDDNVSAIRSVFIDLDGSPLQPVLECAVEPSAIVETSPDRYHCYWLVSDCPVEKFRPIQKALALRFNGDPVICNPSRIMRLPGFYHNKKTPFLSNISSLNSNLIYSIDDIMFALNLDMSEIVTGQDIASFAAQNSIPEGSRNISVFKFGCRLRGNGKGKEEIKEELWHVNQRLCNPPMSDTEVSRIVDSIMRYPVGILQVSSTKVELELGNGFAPTLWASEYLQREKLYYDDGFYRFNGKFYEPIENDLIEAKLQEMGNKRLRARHAEEILRQLRVSIKSNGQPERNPAGYHCLKNGVINADTRKFEPHTDKLFLTYQLGYDFNPDAECKLWERTLEEILPDPLSRQLLQKYAGYTLTTFTKFQVCLFMHGYGSNGKSLIIEVIQALLGEKNYCSLDLKSASQRFMTHTLGGKYANFSNELALGQHNDTNFLKQLIDGSNMTVEKKYAVDAIDLKPFAKFWIASNSLIDSADTSHGFLRRFLFLRFGQVFDETNLDPDRAKKIISSELSGVLNWALKGLELLIEDKGFKPLPQCHHDIFSQTQTSIDPMRDFILSHLRYGNSDVMLKDVYRAWCKVAFSRGIPSGSDTKLRDAIMKLFPEIQKAENYKRSNGGRFMRGMEFDESGGFPEQEA